MCMNVNYVVLCLVWVFIQPYIWTISVSVDWVIYQTAPSYIRTWYSAESYTSRLYVSVGDVDVCLTSFL